jgi:hypothetical protein
VHLGIHLEDVSTKATFADAIQVALRARGYTVARSARS